MKVINTNPARCRDCYRCVRTCQVKAIRVLSEQAEIVDARCILCANCVRACHQRAKVTRDDLPTIQANLAAGRTVLASVAPSAPAYFNMTSFSQMEQFLVSLGFAAAGETAYGAEIVGQAHKEFIDQNVNCQPVIASSCPVIVGLVEKYYPDLIPHLAPIVSPMIAHGRYLRQQYGKDAFVVFIGPCIAKKDEMNAEDVVGAIDAVLTFVELEEWAEAIGLAFPTEQTEENPAERVSARLFPVEGGMIGTATIDTDILSSSTLVVSGVKGCRHVLEGVRQGTLAATFLELMACSGGCINGPTMMQQENVALSRQRVLDYAKRRQLQPMPTGRHWLPLVVRGYHNRGIAVSEFTDEQIQEVLYRVEKYSPLDQLNCGTCGYDTCREKAIAVLSGMAEATMSMCVPYMRSRAELTNVVMDVTPDAVLIVDNALQVQDISAAAEKMFNCRRKELRGKTLHDLIPIVDDFLTVRDTGQPLYNKIVHLQDNLTVEKSIVPVNGKDLLVVILFDVTERENHRKEMESIRAETLQRTKEVITKQMRVAHEIAGLLGETTAETKSLLTRLARLIKDPEEQK